MLDERPIVIFDDPPWIVVRPDLAAGLHGDLLAAGFGASPPVECGSHGCGDGLGRFMCIQLDAGDSAFEAELWIGTLAELALAVTREGEAA